jgi:cytoskeletal protein CcmA (bactofilin family)
MTKRLVLQMRLPAGAQVEQRHAGRLAIALLALATATAPLAGCGDVPGGDESHKINGSVHVDASRPLGSAETVNGSIHVDAGARVTHAATVNGAIHLGTHASAESVKTVNGSVTLDDGARVSGEVASVNGSLTLHAGADVGGALRNVSGRIEVTGAHVGGQITTVAGDVQITGPSNVDGGLHIEKPSGIQLTGSKPRVVVGPGAVVSGELRFDREIDLFVSDKATVGTITGAKAVSFTGDAPP